MRWLAHLVLGGALAGSVGLTVWSASAIARDPLLRPILDSTVHQIVATTDRDMARRATPQRLADLIDARLRQQPRNWVALQALMEEARLRDLPMPPATDAAFAAAWDEDSSLRAAVTGCAACAYDPAACTLSNLLICQAPVALTPVGDLAGIARAGVAWSTGGDVDEIDLGLSVLGLGATGLVLASGGASGMVKAGASTAKLARRMDLLSPRLTAMAGDAVQRGVDWTALPAVRSVADLRRAVRAEAFAPLTSILLDLDRLRVATSTPTALHLLPLIDTASDSSRLARAGEALGPRLVARAEVLGKTRLLRATIRVGDTALALIGGMIGMALTIAQLVGGAVQTAVLRALRRAAR